jgi:hypothetical protein
MCTVSMVYDHFEKQFEPYKPHDFTQWPTQGQFAHKPSCIEPEIAALKQLIEEFKEALAAAKRLDVLTKQPDCFDPKKATLEERVAELERRFLG